MSFEDFDWLSLGDHWREWKDLASQASTREDIDNPLGWVRYLRTLHESPSEAHVRWYTPQGPIETPKHDDASKRLEKRRMTRMEEYEAAFTKEDPRMTQGQLEAMVSEYFKLTGKQRKGK